MLTESMGKTIAGARKLTIEAGKNLSYSTRELRAKAGEPIALTLINPDVVPHNWALIQPGTLSAVVRSQQACG